MKKLYFLLISSIGCSTAVAKTPEIKLDWQGDISSSVQFLAHSRANIGNLGVGVQDALLHLAIEDRGTDKIKAVLGIGILEQFNYEGTLAPFSPIDAGLHYGWLAYQISDQWHWQLGQIDNYAGLENGVSVYNDQIQFGSINNSRSFYYPGFRSIYHDDNIRLYAELVGPEIPNSAITAIGAIVDYGTGNLSLKLSKELDDANYYYSFSLQQSIAGFSLGGALDYTQLGNAPAWQDDTALGVAAYLKYPFIKSYVAIRGEYFDAGNTGIYGYEKAGAITLTYGKDIAKHTFIRYELLYAKSSNNVFSDDKVPVNDQYGIAMQLGMRLGK